MTENTRPDDCAAAVCFHADKVAKLRELMPSPSDLARRADALKALAHPGRLTVLHLLALEECCVCDVAHTLRIPISTASQHLQRLKRAGLVRSRPEGKLVFYALQDRDLVAALSQSLHLLPEEVA